MAATSALAAATLILLVPALALHHPFIFWDSITFYGWGHDILAALDRAWPPLADFPVDRGLWAADGFAGAWRRITPDQFQLVFTFIGARSEFYAVPLYALASRLSLWAPATAQAALAAYVLWIATCAVVAPARPWLYVGIVAALALLTAAPFEAAFLMPDFLTPLAMIALVLLILYRERLVRLHRLVLASVILGAVLVHTSNSALLVVALASACLIARRYLPHAATARWATLVAVLVLAGLGVQELARDELKARFGQEVRTAPFLEGRVIADGPGRRYLRATCGAHEYVACRFKDLEGIDPDHIIWVGKSDIGAPLVNDPTERRRFLDEQLTVVLGAIRQDPLGQVAASFKNIALQLVRFQIVPPMGYSLSGLLREGSDRSMWAAEITPGLAGCLDTLCDHRPVLRYVGWVHYATLAAALAVLGVRSVAWMAPRRQLDEEERRFFALTASLLVAVFANDALCGALSGPFPRYGARVIWLIPLLTFWWQLRFPLVLRRGAPAGAPEGSVAAPPAIAKLVEGLHRGS